MSDRLGWGLTREFAALPEATRSYVLYLGIQAAVLVLAWPAEPLFRLLYDERPPATLFAFAVVFGVTTAYLQLRAGAEELLAEPGRTLGEWALFSPLPLSKLLSTYFAGHFLQSLWLVVLSMPLMVIACVPAGGSAESLVWLVISVLVHGTFFRLLGACLYISCGQWGMFCFALVRFTGLAVYGFFVASVAALSHMELSRSLTGQLKEGGAITVASLPEPITFVAAYAGLSLGLTILLYYQLARHRKRYEAQGNEEL